MTRKKKKPTPQKLHQVSDSSGWTHIIKGPKTTMPSRPSLMQLPTEKLETNYALSQFETNFSTKYTPHWQESQCCGNLTRVFKHEIPFPANTLLTKCVCLGLGSLTVGYRSSSYQLAALMSMLEILGGDHTIREVIFQDPAFNNMDHQFLTSQGYTVVSHPEAFSRIDGNTFLFAPHLDCEFIAMALERALPALCITNNLDEYANGLLTQFAEKRRPGSCEVFKGFLDCTVSRAMPEFDRTTWCQETSIYWLKPQEAEDS